jgi:UrcA family protein
LCLFTTPFYASAPFVAGEPNCPAVTVGRANPDAGGGIYTHARHRNEHEIRQFISKESVMRIHRPFGILSSLLLLGTAALSSAAAVAAEQIPIETKTVNYVQADLQDQASAAALYQRIQRAARSVCQEPNVREVDRYRIYESCYKRAVETAVANVGATALTAVHRNHSRTQAAG